MGLIAYNLIRGAMLDAALRGRMPISRISFKGTRDRLEICGNAVLEHDEPVAAYLMLLDRIIADSLPFRPHRIEPRAIKRRPKCYPLLTEPRKVARDALLNS